MRIAFARVSSSPQHVLQCLCDLVSIGHDPVLGVGAREPLLGPGKIVLHRRIIARAPEFGRFGVVGGDQADHGLQAGGLEDALGAKIRGQSAAARKAARQAEAAPLVAALKSWLEANASHAPTATTSPASAEPPSPLPPASPNSPSFLPSHDL